MTLTLGVQFCDRDMPFISCHMPYTIGAFGVENVIAASDKVNGVTGDYLRSLGVEVVKFPFNQNWADFRNRLIDYAVAKGRTHYMRLDPDEMVNAADVPAIDALLDQYSLLVFPRWNYFYSRLETNRSAYPDSQYRAFRLDGRSRWISQRHEGMQFQGAINEIGSTGMIHVHHYGDVGKQNIHDRALRYVNYARMDAGLPLVDELPPDAQPGANTVPAVGTQPLDPDIVGEFAPFKE